MEEHPNQKIIRSITIKIPSGKLTERLDVFLARQVAELTRSKASEAISQGIVKVDGQPTKPSHKIKPNQLIELEVLSRPPLELTAEDIPLEIIFEDEWLLIVNKPANMVVHPAQGNKTGTLVNAMLGHYKTLAPTDDPDRPGLVHRLDKDTTGLMVVCKQESALSRLAKGFRERSIRREYIAICWWNFLNIRGTVDKPLARDSRDRKKYCVRSDGKHAITHWKLMESFDFMSLLSLKLETGRTHQIRIHMASEGHPIFGDYTYGGRNRQVGKLSSAQRNEVAEYFTKINRQMLHAQTLGFQHPVSGEQIDFSINPPADFMWLLEKLRMQSIDFTC